MKVKRFAATLDEDMATVVVDALNESIGKYSK